MRHVAADPELRQIAGNRSFLAALRQLASDERFSQRKVTEEMARFRKFLAQPQVDQAALAEQFLRSNLYAFAVKLGELLHITPILRAAPEKITGFQLALQKFKEAGTIAGIASLLGALGVLLHFVLTAGLVSGLLGKVMLAAGATSLAGWFLGGAWAAWGLVGVLSKVNRTQPSRLVAGILLVLDPAQGKHAVSESTLYDLYQSTVAAFPNTAYRQHAVDPIKITQLEWVPYLGVKTLYLKGLAQSSSGREYRPIIVFKNVRYHTERDAPDLIEIVASDNRPYLLEKLGNTTNDVLVRCDCKDFYWRFNYYDHEDGSLFGRKRKKYEGAGPPANPMELPGVCKHILKLAKALDHAGIVG